MDGWMDGAFLQISFPARSPSDSDSFRLATLEHFANSAGLSDFHPSKGVQFNRLALPASLISTPLGPFGPLNGLLRHPRPIELPLNCCSSDMRPLAAAFHCSTHRSTPLAGTLTGSGAPRRRARCTRTTEGDLELRA